MEDYAADVTIRQMQETDLPFILSLSSTLIKSAGMPWHEGDIVQQFQDSYIMDMMAETTVQKETFIAEKEGAQAGFLQVREREDEISGEPSGTVPLLAVKPEAQSTGIGKALLKAAEEWSKQRGFRLLHLEVFAANRPARGFYQNMGFQEETVHMIKPLQDQDRSSS